MAQFGQAAERQTSERTETGRANAGPDRCIEIDPGRGLSVHDIEAIAVRHVPVKITEASYRHCQRASDLLDRFIADKRRIYGVTTGYGPLAGSYISSEHAETLQRNLVYHLASGTGDALSVEAGRAVVAARLSALTQGYSAVDESILKMLELVLNAGLAPVIPEKGTVGASGDLTPLAHMALALMGEGEFFMKGRRVPAVTALAHAGLNPVSLARKDGLALVNGTSAMTGIAALTGAAAKRCAELALALSILYAEVLGGYRMAWHPAVGRARGHEGQAHAHALLWSWSGTSEILVDEGLVPPRLPEETMTDGVAPAQPLPQDAYSIRCVPQLVGAVLDVIRFHNDTVDRELNAATDNPLIVTGQEEGVLHAGNFFGQHVSLASDALTNALITLAVHAERKVARLTDDKLNTDLPPFLQRRQTGLYSGFMGAQVTATALVAEMRTKSAPASIQSIPTNANNQDVVTMGTIAARRAGDILKDVTRVLAIEALVLTQAFDLRGGFSGRKDDFAESSRFIADKVRSVSAFLDTDRPLAPDIEAVAAMIAAGDLNPQSPLAVGAPSA